MGCRLFFGRNGLGVTPGVTAGSACRRRGASLALVEPQSPERQPGAPEVDLGPGRRSLGEGPGRAVVRVTAGLFVVGIGHGRACGGAGRQGKAPPQGRGHRPGAALAVGPQKNGPDRSRGGWRLPSAFTLPRVNELNRIVRFNYATSPQPTMPEAPARARGRDGPRAVNAGAGACF